MKHYELSEQDLERLKNDFIYHPPCHPHQIHKFETLRDKFKEMATFMLRRCPRSRELSCALTQLEQANFSANAAIARNEKPSDYEEQADAKT